MKKKNLSIVILGGGLVKIGGKWRTTTFFEKDFSRSLGDRYRIFAGVELYKKLSGEGVVPKILVSGGVGRGVVEYPDHPVISDIMADELIGLGVPKTAISRDRNANSTFEQLKFISKLFSIGKNNEDILVVSNKYHVPRIRAMIAHSPELILLRRKLSDRRLKLVSAESVLIRMNPGRWRREISMAYGGDFAIERIRIERKGVRQIANKTYRW